MSAIKAVPFRRSCENSVERHRPQNHNEDAIIASDKYELMETAFSYGKQPAETWFTLPVDFFLRERTDFQRDIIYKKRYFGIRRFIPNGSSWLACLRDLRNNGRDRL